MIKIGKKGPEAIQVTGINGTPLKSSQQNSPILRTRIADQLPKNNSKTSQDSWNSHNNSRHSSTENYSRSGTRRFRRHTLSASENTRGSRQSINSRPSSSEGRGRQRGGAHFNGRAVSSEGRSRNRGNRFQAKNNFRGTMPSDGSVWGSRFNNQDESSECLALYDFLSNQ